MNRLTACSILAIAFPFASYAGDEPEHRVFAKPVVRVAPTYPRVELVRGNQGWVELSFVVSKEGKVLDPVVEASSGSRHFESAAVRSVKNFRYEPATVNGEPVRQCKTKTRISFAIEGSTDKVSRKFHRGFKRIEKLLNEQEVEQAEERLEAMFESKGLTLGEISWLWALKARIASVTGDKDAELTAVKRALGSSEQWLPDDLRAALLNVRVVREIETGNYAGALESWKRLKAMDDAAMKAIEPAIAEIRKLAASDTLFYQEGRIGESPACESCDSNWQYQPLRRSIELADVDGKLDSIELRCDWQHFVDEARPGKAWQIPEDWGDCKVIVLGEPGTRFKLYEIPAAG